MQPLVSIVITTYNGGKYLAEQLDSIVGQTYRQLEIIISDDASSDDTLAIAQRYAAQDARIVLLRHDSNVGLHANLDAALARASGEYIAISDQDDIWRSDKIEKQLSLLNGAVGVYSDSALIDATGNSLGFTLFQSLNIKASANISRTVPLFFKNCVSGHALLFHRALLSMVLPFSDDFIFDHQLALAASCFGGLRFCDEPLVYHRIHGENHTNAGLAGESARKAMIVDRNAERRTHRFQQRQRIQYVLDRMPLANDALQAHGVCDDGLLQDIAEIPAEMARYDQVLFNLRLFNLLRKLGSRHRYCRKLRLTRCFTLAKGARWRRR
ncbi:MAG TPA: glycosyltransferase family 2 protein [Pseudomonadales bacterium]|nr:glycosyltransferase family 2 protein [Pseudomonadales bacterium]